MENKCVSTRLSKRISFSLTNLNDNKISKSPFTKEVVLVNSDIVMPSTTKLTQKNNFNLHTMDT